MAQTCPCGCGSKVPFGKGGAAKAYRLTEDALRVDREMADYARRVSSDAMAMARISSLIETGQDLRFALVQHLHGTAQPGRTPDLLHLKRDLDLFLENSTNLVQAGIATRQAQG